MTDLKKRARALKPLVRIGKYGATRRLLSDIDLHLRKRKLIKIKMLPTFVQGKNKKEEVRNIVAQTRSTLVYHTGFVFALHRK